ncbi:MAG: hypothetical protein K2P67_02480 [Gallionellaceae bacterium]|nr:hypothetical protein [Gallionellaceae bacterium]
MSDEIVVPSEAQMKSLRSLTQVVYVLYALSYFAGITAIVGIIINYVKKEEVAGTWLESHFRWQIRTFWFGLLWAVIGIATVFILIGFAVLFANFCWIIYRIVKGWLNLNDNKPMIF